MVDIKSVISLACIVLVVVAFVIMVFSWFGMMRSMIKILRNIKPNTPIIRSLLGNHLNAIFRPEFLTDDGLVARRVLFKSAGAFIISSLVGYLCFSYIGLL